MAGEEKASCDVVSARAPVESNFTGYVFSGFERALIGVMRDDFERALEKVAAALIDARSMVEDLDVADSQLNELHGEITRAHAMCAQLLATRRYPNSKSTSA